MKITEFVTEDWQKTNRKDKTSGMSRKAVKQYRRENPGSKLQTAVTTKPSKLKKGSKSAKRRKSFCARMRGMKKSRTSAKTARNPNSNINKALRRWNCESIEQMQELVMIAEQKIAALRQGMAEGQLEFNTPDPVVVVQDKAGKILDTVNLSVAAQKYQLGRPDAIKKQLAHQNYTIIGNYTIVSPMTGQPQDATTQGVAENTTPDDEKVIELFAQIVADDTGYSVKKVNYEIYDEGLRTPSGIPVYFYSFDGDVRYIGALPGGKPTAIVNQDGEVGSRGSHLELSIGGQVEYVIKGKTLFSAADQQQIAKAKPGGDEYSLVLIALDLMWGRMQHKFMEQGAAEGAQLSIQQLATISDEALDKAYGYGRSNAGNTFGWQANLMSAAYAKKMIDAGVTDIEKISDAIHKGWNVTAQKFVQNPDQFDDTEKLRQAGKLDAKLQQRAKLMKINYAQLDNEEQEKDRVVARALLQAIRGEQGVAEGAESIVAVIDGVRSDRTYNDRYHAHNSLSKLVGYGKAKVAELYINGEKIEHFELGKKYIDFEPKSLGSMSEAGPFSYGAKKPRKGSVADLAAQKRKEQERGKQPIEPRDHMVGVARVIK